MVLGNQELIPKSNLYLTSTLLITDSLVLFIKLDLHLDNILLHLPKSFDSMSADELYIRRI